MAIVFIPAQLRELTGGITSTEVDAKTLEQVIDHLEKQFPGIKSRLCENDQIASTLQISIDGAITSRGLLARIDPGSEVHFLPAIGGG